MAATEGIGSSDSYLCVSRLEALEIIWFAAQGSKLGSVSHSFLHA